MLISFLSLVILSLVSKIAQTCSGDFGPGWVSTNSFKFSVRRAHFRALFTICILIFNNNNKHSYKPMVHPNKEFLVIVCYFKACFLDL